MMDVKHELSSEKLRNVYNCLKLDFETTEQIEPTKKLIGQERAVRAMEFGLKMKKPGYNIFIAGSTGTGKTSYAHSLVNDTARKEETPRDWCYVYNFENPDKPIALDYDKGKGKEFKRDMEKLLDILKSEIQKAFNGEDYDKEKTTIIQEYQQKSTELMEELNSIAEQEGFILKRSGGGFVTVPMVDGNSLSEEEYNKLDKETKRQIEEKTNNLQFKIMETVKKIKVIEKETRNRIQQLDRRIGISAIGTYIDELKDKYSCNDCSKDSNNKILRYFEDVEKDVLDNIDKFKDIDDEDSVQHNPFITLNKMSNEEYMHKYNINLFVDNSDVEGAPVVSEYNPTYPNLVGKFEYVNQFGMLKTDFTRIKSGLLHQANGGYLILNVNELFSNPYSWYALKRALKSGVLSIETLSEIYGGITPTAMKPEPIPLKIKIILIGQSYAYYILHSYDDDFKKLFKIRVDFDYEMKKDYRNIEELAGFISYHCQKAQVRHFDSSGVLEVMNYSSRLTGHQNKLSTRFSELVDIIYEADVWAGMDDAEYVNEKHVKKAIEEKRYRAGKYKDKMQEMFQEGSILIDIDGKKAGQVNGLSVIDQGDFSFGRPSRITAVTYAGQEGIINIERETKMSGRIHDKGVMILGGYLGEKFAQDIPLSVSASICFEQSYSGIEGDSASSAELYALLSSLSGVPLKQYIAVTGSVNQKGEIQPIGGVNEKIEGFFEVCKVKGITGKQGVIIPVQNEKNLILSEEVVKAVEQGKFHIYAVETVEQGIEVLTAMPAGMPDKAGSFSEDTVYGKVYSQLKKYAKVQKKDEDDE